jgi:hypothetical protein
MTIQEVINKYYNTCDEIILWQMIDHKDLFYSLRVIIIY